MHRQIKFADGVYVTDFRPNCELKGIDTSNSKVPTADVSLLLQKMNCNESKVKQLIFSIETMQQESGWETDSEFVQAVNEDYERIISFSGQMKEMIVQLASLKYKPENDQIEELIDANRISQREMCIKEKFAKFLKEDGERVAADAQKQGKGNKAVEVSNESERKNSHQINKDEKSQKRQTNNEQQMADEDEDEGVYL